MYDNPSFLNDDNSILFLEINSDEFHFQNQNNSVFKSSKENLFSGEGLNDQYYEKNPSETKKNEIVFEYQKLSDIQKGKIPNSNHSIFPENNPKKNSKVYDGYDSTNTFTNKKFTKKLKKKQKQNKKNLKIKAKRILINVLTSYVNNIIKKVYGGKIGQGIINQKIIRKINPSVKENITIKYNRKLLKTTLKDILSDDISKKYTSVLISNINKKIIDDLLNEENEEKRRIFTDLFNKTFIEWVLMLSKPEGELKDLYEKELYKRKIKDENEIKRINEIIKNFEKEFLNKKMLLDRKKK